ncbi:unnamed protein product [Adineta steineri]|nr:unnamed protein product [Adineta steineri]
MNNYELIDKNFLDSICGFLKEFDQGILHLSSDTKPTIYLVIPFKQYLLNHCKIHPNDQDAIQQIKIFFEKRRRDVWVLHNVHYITILLHPSFKNFDISPDLHEKTIDLVKDELLKRQLSTLYISSTTNIYSLANTPTPDHSSTATKSLLSKSFDSPKTNSQSALSSFDELTEYMALDFQRNENDDILLF